MARNQFFLKFLAAALNALHSPSMHLVKLVSDTSYGSLWEVSFTLKEF
jgi:hypothetical protein